MSTKNCIQKLIEDPLPFPQTYAQLLVVFLIIPTLILTFYPTSLVKHSAFKKIKKLIPFLLVIALVQASIWDNYGSYIGIWTFSDKVFGHIGFLPLEEYTWIVMQVLISIIFTTRVWISFSSKSHSPINANKSLLFTLIGTLFYLVLMLFGANSLHSYLSNESDQNSQSYLCSGIILSFFAPFILLEWLCLSKTFYQNKAIWILSWIIPGIYTYFVDCLAVHQKIWTFDYSYTLNIWLFGFVNTDILILYIIATQICSFPIFGWLANSEQSRQKAE